MRYNVAKESVAQATRPQRLTRPPPKNPTENNEKSGSFSLRRSVTVACVLHVGYLNLSAFHSFLGPAGIDRKGCMWDGGEMEGTSALV